VKVWVFDRLFRCGVTRSPTTGYTATLNVGVAI
jgi:hypothetical protein